MVLGSPVPGSGGGPRIEDSPVGLMVRTSIESRRLSNDSDCDGDAGDGGGDGGGDGNSNRDAGDCVGDGDYGDDGGVVKKMVRVVV